MYYDVKYEHGVMMWRNSPHVPYNSRSATERDAREAERESNWRLAEAIWLHLGNNGEARACGFIAAAIEEGDRFRDAIKKAVDAEKERHQDELIKIYRSYEN